VVALSLKIASDSEVPLDTFSNKRRQRMWAFTRSYRTLWNIRGFSSVRLPIQNMAYAQRSPRHSIVVPMLNEAPYREDVWGSEGIAQKVTLFTLYMPQLGQKNVFKHLATWFVYTHNIVMLLRCHNLTGQDEGSMFIRKFNR
jgi:hypothetical protein